MSEFLTVVHDARWHILIFILVIAGMLYAARERR